MLFHFVKLCYNHLMKLWIVDAFATKPYTGNPAAVTIVESFPDEAQKIAAEMNLSETAFVKPLGQGHFHIRWFTPKVEVKLCGHATLASAHILHQEYGLKEVVFESLSGPLRVTCQEELYTLDFPLQKTGRTIDIPLFKNRVIAVDALDDVIIELASEAEVRQFVPNPAELLQIECRGIIITARGSGSYDFVSRFFGPRVGVNEDPVTGSAHCKLAHYWQQKLGKSEFLAYQASERGGEIAIAVRGDRVYLSGRAVTVLEGMWRSMHGCNR